MNERAILDALGRNLSENVELGETDTRAFLARVEAASGVWPDLDVDLVAFAGFVSERLDPPGDPTTALARLSLADLYLVHACLQDHPSAPARFLQHVSAPVRRAVAKLDPGRVDDTLQDLYQHLFLGDGRPPKIHAYRGMGDLRRWVCVVALRLGLNEQRRERRISLKAPALEAWNSTVANTELDYLRDFYRREFKSAFAHALEALEGRQRNVLRYHMDGLTADQIARMYRVHRVTVARWLSGIRARLFAHTRRELVERLSTVEGDVDSIMRLLDGELSASIQALVAC